MRLSDIFTKPIDRPIEGVIKADDAAALFTEVDEYVVTNEVAKRLEDFLAAYTHYQNANGVWISGFFGSGKSHLLKMLALLLENETVDGQEVLDLFLSKPNVADNAILQAELKRAAAIPSRSILFNIDQKADAVTKQQFDALLAVFVKVFNETCGYFGKQGYIAQFERDLDARDEYLAFQEAYAHVAGKPWERGREQVVLEGPNIAQAYAQATGTPVESAKGILDKYRADYKLSIEDFANQVNDYIEREGPEFRLNFFVDEVGQYIADNTKLMTNLQTIAESLNTRCRGRAWLLVTAQEDMSTVMGEMGTRQSYDFSKIQARFATRMKLTSANVDEVIHSRLLAKHGTGIDLLGDLYAEQQNNLRTLFEFRDGSRAYRNYRDRDEFIDSYPFVPYQYSLFQAGIQNLSLHNAFEGKHRSVGERSMLSVFQQVVMEIADQEIGCLATFDLMYAGIRNTLKGQITGAIRTAEEQLTENPFAVQVLKALFLVKYVKEFKATARNISILLIDRFDIDLNAHRKRVQAALDDLERQTYIQRNGEEYEYLTDEEKDIEDEIKHTDVETNAVAEELSKLIFDGVLRGERKIRYENGQDYWFTRMLDDRLQGRDYELGIHVVSPFYEHAGNLEMLHAQSMGRDELYVVLPVNERLVIDLLMFKRTEKYIQQNLGITQVDSVRRILESKRQQNRDRYLAIRATVESMLTASTLLISGRQLEISSTDPRTRITLGFHDLVARAYPNLRMLRNVNYAENQIAALLRPETTLLGTDAATMSEAEQEILGYIRGQERSGMRTTMQGLVTRFERKPYGWYLAAIQCILAKLVGRGMVEVRRDANVLENAELEQALRNTRGFANLILDPQVEIPAPKVRALRDFYNDFFDQPPQANEAKALGRETAQAFTEMQTQLRHLTAQVAEFPFLAALDDAADRLQAFTGKQYAFYFNELLDQEDALLDLKESVIGPLRRFMHGQQREIYAQARRFLVEQDPNLRRISGTQRADLQAILDDPHCYQGDHMIRAKALLDDLRAQVDALVAAERTRALEALEARWSRLTAMAEFADLTDEQQAQLRRPFDSLKQRLETQTLIAVIRDALNGFDNREYHDALRLMTQWSHTARYVPPDADDEGEAPVFHEAPIDYVTQTALRPSYAKAWLADEADVDAYLDALRDAMLEAIRNGARIQL